MQHDLRSSIAPPEQSYKDAAPVETTTTSGYRFTDPRQNVQRTGSESLIKNYRRLAFRPSLVGRGSSRERPPRFSNAL